MARKGSGIADGLTDLAARAVLATALRLPYALRVPFVGWVVAQLIAPLAGWRRRIRDNLDHALPELGAAERARILREVPDNVGRALIEIYSGEEFLARIRDTPIDGPGLEAFEAARRAGRPVVLATAHLGNYDVVRGRLAQAGHPMAALYRPMLNPRFNAHYVAAIARIAEPVYPTDARGLTRFVRHLKEGGIVGIVADVGSSGAPVLRFFGRPARTPVSAAEWALRYGALLIPVFGLREPDGLGFRIHVAQPIPEGTAESMMQAYNDVVEAVVRAHPGQWFWIHRRWKGVAGGAVSADAPPRE